MLWHELNVEDLSDSELSKVTEEINTIKKIHHISMINFIAGWFDEKNKVVVIVTDLISNRTLREHLIKIGSPRLKVIKGWCHDILSCLDYLHTLSPPVSHQEISLDNIFIDKKDGKVKLGICSFLSHRDCTDDIKDFGRLVLEIINTKKKKADKDIIDEISNNPNLVLLLENSLSQESPISAEKLLDLKFFKEEESEIDDKPVQFKSYRYKSNALKKILKDLENESFRNHNNFSSVNENPTTADLEKRTSNESNSNMIITIKDKTIRNFPSQVFEKRCNTHDMSESLTLMRLPSDGNGNKSDLFICKNPRDNNFMSTKELDIETISNKLNMEFTLDHAKSNGVNGFMINFILKRQDWKLKKRIF